MSATFTSVELRHRILGTQVRMRALQMWNGMVAAGTAPADRDYTDLIPEAAEALVASMLAKAAAHGLTLPTVYRPMNPAYDLRITFSFADKIDATAFKIIVI